MMSQLLPIEHCWKIGAAYDTLCLAFRECSANTEGCGHVNAPNAIDSFARRLHNCNQTTISCYRRLRSFNLSSRSGLRIFVVSPNYPYTMIAQDVLYIAQIRRVNTIILVSRHPSICTYDAA